MTYSPSNLPFLNMPIITTASQWSVGQQLRTSAAGAASAAWVTANQARYVPFWLPMPFTVVKLLVYCGATGGGNNDVGLYNASGAELIAATAAAHPAAAAWQEFDVTDTTLTPGLYYIGLLNTTTTATFFVYATKEYGRAAGVFSQAVGAGTLPTPTATFAALDAAVVPLVGMSNRTLI